MLEPPNHKCLPPPLLPLALLEHAVEMSARRCTSINVKFLLVTSNAGGVIIPLSLIINEIIQLSHPDFYLYAWEITAMASQLDRSAGVSKEQEDSNTR